MAKKLAGLKTGQRYEFVCLQLDIAGHSKLKDAERILHAAKERFYHEIAGTITRYNGFKLKWEGDGGAFLFRVTDGQEFDQSVSAAIEILESLPGVNRELQDTTGLTQPLAVRVSLDKGEAVYNTNPGLITGDFLNAFLKHERAVSLANEVTITERIHCQLDQALRERFVEYQHSAEVKARLYHTSHPEHGPASPPHKVEPAAPFQAPANPASGHPLHQGDEKFRTQIRDKLRRLSKETIKHDGEETPILNHLCAILECPIAIGPDQAEGRLAEFLLEYHELTLPALVRAFTQMMGQGDKTIASRLGEIIDLVTPLQLPPQLWDGIRGQVAQNPAVLERAATGLICAEAVAARLEGLAMSVVRGTDGKLKLPSLVGQFSAEHLPLGAPDGAFTTVVKDLYLASNLGLGRMMGSDSARIDKMLRDLAGSFRSARLIQERVPYVVVKLPEGREDRKHWLQAIESVKREIKHDVMFIELRSDPDVLGFDGFVLTCLNTRFESEGKSSTA
jgi:hypothetical protein